MAKILVVDDVAGIRTLVCELLRLDGHDVWGAHDGVSALEAASQQQPDMVLLDQSLPDMSGDDVAERLGDGLPLVLMSGVWPRVEEGSGWWSAHLPKPFSIAQLRDTVAALVGSLPRIAAA